ncbi:Deoxyribonuclease-1 [Balamuthia mandrillaris]
MPRRRPLILLSFLFLSFLTFSASSKGEEDKNIKMASFHLGTFAKEKAADFMRLIRRYDLLILQEIRDTSAAFLMTLLGSLNQVPEEEKYELEISEPVGMNGDERSYAVFYKASALTLMKKHTFSNDEIPPDPSIPPSPNNNVQSSRSSPSPSSSPHPSSSSRRPRRTKSARGAFARHFTTSSPTTTDTIKPFTREPFFVRFAIRGLKPNAQFEFTIAALNTAADVPKQTIADELNSVYLIYEENKQQWKTNNTESHYLAVFNRDCPYISKKGWREEIIVWTGERYTWNGGEAGVSGTNSLAADLSACQLPSSMLTNVLVAKDARSFRFDTEFGLAPEEVEEAMGGEVHYPVELFFRVEPFDSVHKFAPFVSWLLVLEFLLLGILCIMCV